MESNVRCATLKRRTRQAELELREQELSHAKSWYMNEQPVVRSSPLRRSLVLTSSTSLPSLVSPAQSNEQHIAQVRREVAELKDERSEIKRLLRLISAQV